MVSRESRDGVAPCAADSDITLRDLLEETRSACVARLRDPDLAAAASAAAQRGVDRQAAYALVERVDERSETRAAIERLRADLPADVPFEAWLLLSAAVESLPLLRSLPVPGIVIELLCADFRHLAASARASRLTAATPAFVETAKKSTLRRFPAGQFEWEVSGIPRSYLLRVSGRELPRVLTFVAARMRGLRPVFFSHLNRRRPQVALSEREALRSYARMAAAIRLQPSVVGFAACSWFRSPDTHAVSPHLAWLSDVFVRNGGLVTVAGAVDPECGVLHRSATRRRLFEAGQFTPTQGLVLWPRRAMLAWADAHPELMAA